MRKPLLYKRTQLNSITRSRHYFCNLKNMMKPKKKIKEKKNWRGMENGKKEREECLGASWQVSPVLGWGPLLGWRGRCIFHGEPPPAPLPRRVGMRWHSPAFSHLERLLGKKRIGTIQTETGVAILPPRAGRKWPGVERTAFKDSRMEKTEAASTWSIFSAVCETAPGFY